MVPIWLPFLICLMPTAIFEPRLSRCGNIIATRCCMGGTCFGIALAAKVTSLRELNAGVSSATLSARQHARRGHWQNPGSHPFDTTLLAAGDLACMQVSPLRHAARIAAMLMSVIVTAGLLSRTRSQLLGCAGGISHLLLAPCAFRTYLLYRHGE